MHGINFFTPYIVQAFLQIPSHSTKPHQATAASGYVVRLVGGALVGRQAYAEFTQLMKVMVALSVMCLAEICRRCWV
jgi:hypothetical protein